MLFIFMSSIEAKFLLNLAELRVYPFVSTYNIKSDASFKSKYLSKVRFSSHCITILRISSKSSLR